jgi:hypothetical protein
MGNQPPSSPCFDDQVYTTLSWADAQGSCRNLVYDSCNATCNSKHNSPKKKQEAQYPKDPTRPPKPEQREDLPTPLSNASDPPCEPLPALTDNLSSSGSSSSGPVAQQQQKNQNGVAGSSSSCHIQQYPIGTATVNSQLVDVIELHHHQPMIPLNPSQNGDDAGGSGDGYYNLGWIGAASSNDYTNGTSGSLERDARVDLGTSRGSGGGTRDDFGDEQDEYRMDVSLSDQQAAEFVSHQRRRRE